MVKRGRMYSKQNWKWMLARLWENENVVSKVGQEFDVTTTMPPIIDVLEIIPMCYLPIRAESSVNCLKKNDVSGFHNIKLIQSKRQSPHP